MLASCPLQSSNRLPRLLSACCFALHRFETGTDHSQQSLWVDKGDKEEGGGEGKKRVNNKGKERGGGGDGKKEKKEEKKRQNEEAERRGSLAVCMKVETIGQGSAPAWGAHGVGEKVFPNKAFLGHHRSLRRCALSAIHLKAICTNIICTLRTTTTTTTTTRTNNNNNNRSSLRTKQMPRRL